MSADTTTSLFSKNAAPKQDAALTGASKAFGKPPVKSKSKVNNTYSGSNGALAAAKRVSPSRNASLSRREQPVAEQRLLYQRSGSSIGSENDWEHSAFLQRRMGTGNGHLQPPLDSRDPSKSPSFIAATLAASRSVPVSPAHTGQALSPAALQKLAGSVRRSSASVRSGSSRGSSEHVLDTTSIPPTHSLIGMFERSAAQTPKKKAPKQQRAFTPEVQMSPMQPQPGTPSPVPAQPRTPSPKSAKRPPEIQSPKPQFLRTHSALSSPKTFASPAKSQLAERPLTSSGTTVKPASKPAPKPKPAPLPRRSSTPGARSNLFPIPPQKQPEPAQTVAEDEDDSSDDSFVSASDYQPDDYQPSIHALYNQRARTPSVTRSARNRDVESLANAIVASSLASSRAASPSRASINSSLYPPPPPARRHLFHHGKDIDRTPSPAKGGFRTTMRKPKEEEDEGEKRRSRKHLVKKHPNKHHEGDRKRWRDEITARERKRYEAVWASNKGLFPTAPNSEASVCNLVVQDIWSRSRLHADVLEEVYSLVDRKENGRLEKEEFVVGLWLVDQRLKGRKLPIRVSDSVWRSASGVLGGLKVKRVGK
ncbi:hypothetical protein BP5796_00673 [Coleophoma crateriformis]|uniref:EH domain-containing protein n=1 Tax=Coleophoma crateriformis TaxID=565419 RepID=A0A3D8T8N2_9HELO|nr:hypothetical protein BP5796_00673 [Coleophoma crateriformis]